MKKQEFLTKLKKKLSVLPKKEREERISFYAEMLDDRIEEGLSEEEAVEKIGAVDEIASEILTEALSKEAVEKATVKKRRSAFQTALLVVSFPIWLSLLIVAFALVFSFYAVLFALAISLCAVFVALGVCAPACLVAGIIALFSNGYLGFALIGVGFVCAGLSIFLFIACKSAVKGIVAFLKKCLAGNKRFAYKKEAI